MFNFLKLFKKNKKVTRIPFTPIKYKIVGIYLSPSKSQGLIPVAVIGIDGYIPEGTVVNIHAPDGKVVAIGQVRDSQEEVNISLIYPIAMVKSDITFGVSDRCYITTNKH